MEIEKRTINYDDGSYREIYHKKGDKDYWHKVDGPAYIAYNPDGSIQYEEYWINNQRHRVDGPACIDYNPDGSIRCEEYWINGEELYKEEWYKEFGWKLKLKGTPMEAIYK